MEPVKDIQTTVHEIFQQVRECAASRNIGGNIPEGTPDMANDLNKRLDEMENIELQNIEKNIKSLVE